MRVRVLAEAGREARSALDGLLRRLDAIAKRRGRELVEQAETRRQMGCGLHLSSISEGPVESARLVGMSRPVCCERPCHLRVALLRRLVDG